MSRTMGAFMGLAIIGVAILIIWLGARWSTSDVDHYMGFDNLRSKRKIVSDTDDDKGS
jgi:hypothetical protein